jgi:hypothetical protein
MARSSQARKEAKRVAFQRWYKKHGRAYRQRPDVKAKQLARQRSPEHKAKLRAYKQRSDVVAKRRAYARAYYRKRRAHILAWKRTYRQRTDVKAKQRTRRRAWWLAHREDPERRAKRRAYLQRPHIRAKLREVQRAYRKTRRWKAWNRVYNLRPDVKARQRVHLRTYMARRKGASIKIASTRRWGGIRIVRALTRGKQRKLSLLINGEPAKTSETVAALVACLYGHLGQVVPYNQLGPAIGYRRARSLQRPVLRQYVYVVEQLLAKHKAPYVITVARDVGYALCPIARRTNA